MRLHTYGCDDGGGEHGRLQGAGCATRLAGGRCVLLKVFLVGTAVVVVTMVVYNMQ
jgi:hypothetical protein